MADVRCGVLFSCLPRRCRVSAIGLRGGFVGDWNCRARSLITVCKSAALLPDCCASRSTNPTSARCEAGMAEISTGWVAGGLGVRVTLELGLGLGLGLLRERLDTLSIPYRQDMDSVSAASKRPSSRSRISCYSGDRCGRKSSKNGCSQAGGMLRMSPSVRLRSFGPML